jgi:hypothetical protein
MVVVVVVVCVLFYTWLSRTKFVLSIRQRLCSRSLFVHKSVYTGTCDYTTPMTR